MDKIKLRLCLLALDVLAAVGLYGSRPYVWVAGKGYGIEWRMTEEARP